MKRTAPDADHERTWALVQEQLDQRRDPLEDPAVREALREDPALAREVLALCDALEQVSAGPAAPPSSPVGRPLLLVPALLTAAVVCLGAWLLGSPRPARDAADQRLVAGGAGARAEAPVPAEPPPAILGFTLTVARARGEEQQTRTVQGDADGFRQERSLHTPQFTTRWTERIGR